MASTEASVSGGAMVEKERDQGTWQRQSLDRNSHEQRQQFMPLLRGHSMLRRNVVELVARPASEKTSARRVGCKSCLWKTCRHSLAKQPPDLKPKCETRMTALLGVVGPGLVGCDRCCDRAIATSRGMI